MFLSTFERRGGVQALVDMTARFAKAFNELDSSDQVLHIDHVPIFSGLKVTLSLLQLLVSSKVLFESVQTGSITTKDRKAIADEDFEPHRFLVKLRATVFPFIREVWTSTWLESAPISVIRSVIQALLRIMDADSEERLEPVPSAGISLVNMPAIQARPPPPAERIQQLVDMGFTASAAHQALVRCHNNTSLATEFLLSHPGVFDAPAPPAAEAAASETSAAASGDAEMALPGNEENRAQEQESQEEASPSAASQSKDKGKEKESAVSRWEEDRRPQLSTEREALRPELAKRALGLADKYEDLVADIKPAFIRSKDAVRLLVEQTVPLKAQAFGESTGQMVVRLRLLATVVHEDPSAFKDDAQLVEQTMSLIVSLLPSPTVKEDKSNRPKWLPYQLLVAEGLFIMSEDIVEVPLDENNTSPSSASPNLFTGPSFAEARQTLFDRCVEIVEEDGLSREEISAALQVLVLLTRDHALAVEFAQRGGVASAMKVFKASEKRSTSGCQHFISPILRHIVEEPQALVTLMQREIRQWFTSPSRTKVVDVTHFVKNNKQIALRNPALFLEAVASECVLVQPTPLTGNHHIKLRPSAETDAKTEDKPAAESSQVVVDAGGEMQVDEPTLSEPSASMGSEVLESMVHQLLNELTIAGKQAVAAISSEAEAPEVKDTTSPKTTNDQVLPVSGSTLR